MDTMTSKTEHILSSRLIGWWVGRFPVEAHSLTVRPLLELRENAGLRHLSMCCTLEGLKFRPCSVRVLYTHGALLCWPDLSVAMVPVSWRESRIRSAADP